MGAVWGKITAGEIAKALDGDLLQGRPEMRIRGISTDSREIKPGEIFWALKGERFDGHDFVSKALRKGASGLVIRKGFHGIDAVPTNSQGTWAVIAVEDTLTALGRLAAWWRRQHRARVVAITGSVGKTTTKEMTAMILDLSGMTLKNRGNLNNLIGLPLTLLRLDTGHVNAVLEMGMNRPGEIARLTEIADPQVGLVTNVGRAHLEGVGDIEGVARAKTELIERISPEARVVLNGDDSRLTKAASRFQREVVTFGFGEKNDVRGSKIKKLGREGTLFELHYQGRSCPVRLKVPGLQNVSNALGAASVGFCLDEPNENIVQGLERFEGLKGRFMLIRLPGDILLVDDTYNANPSSLKAALESVKDLSPEGQAIIVGLGDMKELGQEAISAHQTAGRMVAETGASYFAAMGEHARLMVDGAIRAGMPRKQTEEVFTHEEMVEAIRRAMKPGAVILLKASREMALERVVDGLKALDR